MLLAVTRQIAMAEVDQLWTMTVMFTNMYLSVTDQMPCDAPPEAKAVTLTNAWVTRANFRFSAKRLHGFGRCFRFIVGFTSSISYFLTTAKNALKYHVTKRTLNRRVTRENEGALGKITLCLGGGYSCGPLPRYRHGNLRGDCLNRRRSHFPS